LKLNKHNIIHLLELSTILLLSSYALVVTNALNNNPAILEEPPPITGEINDIDSLLNDLQNLGCQAFNVSESRAAYFNGFTLKNYIDFRSFAYKSLIAFWEYTFDPVPSGQNPMDYINGAKLYTPFNGIIIQYAYTF